VALLRTQMHATVCITRRVKSEFLLRVPKKLEINVSIPALD